MTDEAAALIAALDLRPHREGGYFRETWGAAATVATAGGPRPLANSIYYLLTRDSPIGAFHRNAADITHFFHRGGPIVYSLISPAGVWQEFVLGPDLAAGQRLAFTCPGGWWKSSHLPGSAALGLISEIVAPGFAYADHTLADPALFGRLFPELADRWAPYVGGG